MPRYTSEQIQQVKDAILVSDVVKEDVPSLQPSGKRSGEWKGLSPFKNEKTPSFTVSDTKQFYHCFATGKHGSVFDWLMFRWGMTFPEAVEALARRAGISL